MKYMILCTGSPFANAYLMGPSYYFSRSYLLPIISQSGRWLTGIALILQSTLTHRLQ